MDKWHDFKLDKQKHQMPLFYFQTTSGDWMGLELDYDASSLFDHYSWKTFRMSFVLQRFYAILQQLLKLWAVVT